MTDPHRIAESATKQQLETLVAVADGKRPVWIIVCPDGEWFCLRCELERARTAAQNCRGILVEYQPAMK